MNKFRILFLLLVQVTSLASLNGQNGLCFRFVDTLYLKANVLHIWHATCLCPSLSCVVRDDSEKEIALSLFSGESHYSDEDMPPLIAHYVDGDFELNDGNHRHQAYENLGIENVWVIVWITEESEYQVFLEKYGDYVKDCTVVRR